MRLIGQGWDNWAFLVNDEFVFRFPRRKLAAELIQAELKCLGSIRPFAAVPVPDPIFVGAPTAEYPYPFAGYRMLPGIPACQVAWTDEDRAKLASPLGLFLAQVHRITIDSATQNWAPPDTIRRADITWRLPKSIEQAKSMAPLLREHGVDPDRVVAELESFATTQPSKEAPCWVHGDFYPCHFLVDAQSALTGVIDWGDVHLGDRALDLSIAFTFLPASARPEFWSAYGLGFDLDMQNRARFRARHYGLILLKYAVDVANEHLVETAKYALNSCLD